MVRAATILDQLLEHSPVSMQILDRDGLTIRVNDPYLELFGHASRDQVEGVYNPRTNPVIHDLGLDQYIERGYAGEVVHTPAAPFIAPNAPVRDLRATVIPITDDDGILCNVLIVHEDVTALTASERISYRRGSLIAGLQAAYRCIADRQDVEGVLNATLDAAMQTLGADKAAIWKVAHQDKWVMVAQRGLSDDFLTGLAKYYEMKSFLQELADSAVVEARPVLIAGVNQDSRLSGYTDLLAREGLRWSVAVPMLSGDGVAGLVVLYRGSEEGFQPFETEAACLLADQAAVALHNARLFEALRSVQGELELRVQTVTDELNRAHEEAVANEKLAAVGFLAKEVAHGLRNPLNVISSSAYYIRSQCTKADEKVERHFNAISRAVTQAADTISNLITLAAGSAPAMAEVDINDVAQKVLQERQNLGDAPVETEWGSDLPRVQGDWTQLLQAVKSLVANAMAARRAAPVRVRTESSGDGIMISVGDDRPLMTPEERESAFGPFSSTATQWTGLSLSVARQIALGHRGDVVVAVEGGITWFQMRLPCNAPPSQP